MFSCVLQSLLVYDREQPYSRHRRESRKAPSWQFCRQRAATLTFLQCSNQSSFQGTVVISKSFCRLHRPLSCNISTHFSDSKREMSELSPQERWERLGNGLFTLNQFLQTFLQSILQKEFQSLHK